MKLFMKHKYDSNETPTTFMAGGSNIVGSNVLVYEDLPIEETRITFEQIKDYLSTKGCVLWQQWDITSEDGLDDASDWFINEIENLFAYIGVAPR